MKRIEFWLLALVMISARAGWAQPAPDVAWLIITPATLAGTPLTIPITGLSATIADETTHAVAGRCDPDHEREHFVAVNLHPARLRVTLLESTSGARVEEIIDLHEGFNAITLKLPLSRLVLNCTRDGKAVHPRALVVFHKSAAGPAYELAQRLTLLTGLPLTLDGIPPGDSTLLVLTDVGYASLTVTVPPKTVQQNLPVPLELGSMADIYATDANGTPLAGMPLNMNSATYGLLSFFLDDAGHLDGLQLPAGHYTLASTWQWVAQHPDLRTSSQSLVAIAGTPAQATLRILQRQLLILHTTIKDTRMAPTRGITLYQSSKQFLEIPVTWVDGHAEARTALPYNTHLWVLTDQGYGQVQFITALEETRFEKTVPLVADGGQIDITLQGTDVVVAGVTRCTISGTMPDMLGAAAPASFLLPATTPGHYLTPQLPPGKWRVLLNGLQPHDETVEVKAHATSAVTITL